MIDTVASCPIGQGRAGVNCQMNRFYKWVGDDNMPPSDAQGNRLAYGLVGACCPSWSNLNLNLPQNRR